ncbi:MAG: ABC transporter ATP-binding protein [Acidobacteria bacterium]|nr:ABC transporter ATP-binding protein [Acidobacteriota bacterium]
MSDRIPAAIIEDLHVSYRAYEDPKRNLRGFTMKRHEGLRQTRVHAVRGVSLTIYEGETLGIIGANGSGKSTLMVAMTGLMPIDSGSLRVRSRPRLLSVNAALRPAVSGRRNIIIGGLALGIALAEVTERMDEIIDFVNIGEAIDRPMRTYSSGQRSRLGFAIATMSPPDILLVDEALVVGDEEFKARSQEKIDEIVKGAGAVVIISHSLPDIRENTDRAIWMHHGEIAAEGDPNEVVDAYVAMVHEDREERARRDHENGSAPE